MTNDSADAPQPITDEYGQAAYWGWIDGAGRWHTNPIIVDLFAKVQRGFRDIAGAWAQQPDQPGPRPRDDEDPR